MFLTVSKIHENRTGPDFFHSSRAWITREEAEDYAKRIAQTNNGAPEYQVYTLLSTTKTSTPYETEVKLV